MSVDLKLISGGFRYDDDRDRRMQKLALAIAEKALDIASDALRSAFPVDSGAYDLAVIDIERVLRCVKDEVRYQHTLDEWQQEEGGNWGQGSVPPTVTHYGYESPADQRNDMAVSGAFDDQGADQ